MRLKVLQYLSLLFICCYELAIAAHRGRREYAFFNLPFLADMPVEALVILGIPCQVQLQLHFSPPDLIPTQLGSFPVLFPRYLSLLSLPVQFPLAL